MSYNQQSIKSIASLLDYTKIEVYYYQLHLPIDKIGLYFWQESIISQ